MFYLCNKRREKISRSLKQSRGSSVAEKRSDPSLFVRDKPDACRYYLSQKQRCISHTHTDGSRCVLIRSLLLESAYRILDFLFFVLFCLFPPTKCCCICIDIFPIFLLKCEADVSKRKTCNGMGGERQEISRSKTDKIFFYHLFSINSPAA